MPEQFDPSRLVHLAQRRDRLTAVNRDLAARYSEMRETRTQVQRNAALLRDLADHGDPNGRKDAGRRAEAEDARAADLTRQMAEIAYQQQAATEAAQAAIALVNAMLRAAAANSIDIPASLAADAAKVERIAS